MEKDERFLVFAAMRNEGPFIVEWVAWYRMLGFEVLIATNDCTDHSPELLDCLAGHGWLTHVTHAPPAGMPPKKSAHEVARKHPLVAETDWLLICDVDEFLVLHTEDTIGAFIAATDRDFIGMGFSWKCFGTGHNKTYQDRLVHRHFLRAGLPKLKINIPFKSLFRETHLFDKFRAHAPTGDSIPWGTGHYRFVDSECRTMERFNERLFPVRHLPQEQITHARAQMNHYIIRSEESYDLKRGTPSASAGTDRYDDQFYIARNRNGTFDDTALRFKELFDPIYETVMELDGVARLHHLCCADYVARLCAHQGRPAANDERWRHHMAQAERT